MDAIERHGREAARLRAQVMHPVIFLAASAWVGGFLVGAARDGFWWLLPVGLVPAAVHLWSWLNHGSPTREDETIRAVVLQLEQMTKEMAEMRGAGRWNDYAARIDNYASLRDAFARYILTGAR